MAAFFALLWLGLQVQVGLNGTHAADAPQCMNAVKHAFVIRKNKPQISSLGFVG